MGMPTVELKGITFDLMTNTDMVSFYFASANFAREKRNILKADVHFQEKLSSASIVEPSDVTSAKLGLPNGAPQCETCGAQSVRECDGE